MQLKRRQATRIKQILKIIDPREQGDAELDPRKSTALNLWEDVRRPKWNRHVSITALPQRHVRVSFMESVCYNTW